MRQIREALRLHLQAKMSYAEVGRALKISKSVVGNYVLLARVAGVDWASAQTLTDEALEARLYRPAVPRASYQLAPDFGLVHQELKRAGVTLMLLWAGSLAKRIAALPFGLAHWGMSFPLASLAALTLRLATPGSVLAVVGPLLLAVTSLVVLALVLGTVRGLREGTLLAPETVASIQPVSSG